jgi:DNA helicase-2/ATP-dependent DNA helicase PcrA
MEVEYTINQLEAINTIDQDLQIIACAGSGKTDVISMRVVNILKTVKDIKPENIVAFTFTEKAASELKTRIYKRVKENIGEITGMAEMYVGTIHSFCLKLLQDYIVDYQKFIVLDEIKTKLFIDRNFSNIGMKKLNMKRYKDTDIFMSLINILKEGELENKKLDDELRQALIDEYNNCFESHNYFDFSMIMEKVISCLEKDKGLQTKISSRIKYLLVDEYQDVNPIQEKLISIINQLGANLCVVGDDDQTIYQWRGSEIKNILEFDRRYPKNLKSVILAENFRSSQGIIDLANITIKNNKNRKDKQMIYKSKYNYEEGDILYKEFQKPEDECQFIADRIKDLQKVGLKLSDIAILMRIKRLGSVLIEVLKKNEIKFIVEGVNELFSTTEVKASKYIFDYLCGNIDKKALKEIWLSLNYKLNENKIDEGIAYLDNWDPKKYKFYHDYIFQKIFQDYLDIIELKEEENKINPDLEIIFYNLGKFSQVINDFETIYFKSNPENKLKIFCNFLQYTAKEYYPEGHLQNEYIKPDAVRIMTIHQAKGLEFLAVFVPGLSKHIFPHKRPGGKNVWHFLDKNIIKNPDRYDSGNIEDERRLFYVSVTRAKKFLFLTRAVYNQRMNKEISIFLKEAKESNYIFQYDKHIDYSKKVKVQSETEKYAEIILNFSVLEDYYYCPYRFKLSYFYGFIQPIAAPQGYGKSLHNIVMEIHRKFANKEVVKKEDLPEIISRHFYLPYADKKTNENMRQKADKSINDYYNIKLDEFDKIKFVEKDIEIDFGNGVRVNGRIDLVKKKDLNNQEKTYIIDFKTIDKTKGLTINTDLSEEQLKIYSIGYNKLTGEDAHFIEIYNLEDNNVIDRKKLNKEDIDKTKNNIIKAADNIRNNLLMKQCDNKRCKDCYINGICLFREKKKEYGVK